MGLDIGIIEIAYLERPRSRAYEFAWELALEASAFGYMHGEGNNWGPFTRAQIREMLRKFAKDKHLSTGEETEVWSWVETLPWDDENIELHFNW